MLTKLGNIYEPNQTIPNVFRRGQQFLVLIAKFLMIRLLRYIRIIQLAQPLSQMFIPSYLAQIVQYTTSHNYIVCLLNRDIQLLQQSAESGFQLAKRVLHTNPATAKLLVEFFAKIYVWQTSADQMSFKRLK